jgi:hypothetical protein
MTFQKSFYPANLSDTFFCSWKDGGFVYFKTKTNLIKILDVLRPSQCFSPTSLSFDSPSTLTHALRKQFFKEVPKQTLSEFDKGITGDYFYLESPFMKAKRGTFKNINYLDIKSFYFTLHNQLIKHFAFENVKSLLEHQKKELIDLKKYPKLITSKNEHAYEQKEGYDLRENVSDFFVEDEFRSKDVKAIPVFLKNLVSKGVVDVFDKAMLKKSRNLLSFGCFVEYNRRLSRMTPLHSMIPFVAKKIMEAVDKRLKSFYSDTDCLMVKNISQDTAEKLLGLAVEEVNKDLFGFDLLSPSEFRLDSKGTFERMHIFENKFYVYEKSNGNFSWTFAGLPTVEHIPITAMVTKSTSGWVDENQFLRGAIEPALGNSFDFNEFYDGLPNTPLVSLRYFRLQKQSETEFIKSFPHLAIPLDYSPRNLFEHLLPQ